MVNITYTFKKYHCPLWDIDVTLKAKYCLYDKENPHRAKFMLCQCPIVENFKLPEELKNKEFALYRFCSIERECLNTVSFETEITI